MVRLRRPRELLDLARTANDFTRTTTHVVRAASRRVGQRPAGDPRLPAEHYLCFLVQTAAQARGKLG